MNTTRIWAMDRHEDETGVSGTGVIGWVIDLDDDGVFVAWDTAHTPSTLGWYPDLDAVRAIHGHNGKTELMPAQDTTRAEQLFRHNVGRAEDAVMRLAVVLDRMEQDR